MSVRILLLSILRAGHCIAHLADDGQACVDEALCFLHRLLVFLGRRASAALRALGCVAFIFIDCTKSHGVSHTIDLLDICVAHFVDIFDVSVAHILDIFDCGVLTVLNFV